MTRRQEKFERIAEAMHALGLDWIRAPDDASDMILRLAENQVRITRLLSRNPEFAWWIQQTRKSDPVNGGDENDS